VRKLDFTKEIYVTRKLSRVHVCLRTNHYIGQATCSFFLRSASKSSALVADNGMGGISEDVVGVLGSILQNYRYLDIYFISIF
jgi:hypothetical protein